MQKATWPTEAAKTFPPWGQARYIQKTNRLNTQRKYKIEFIANSILIFS